MLGLEAEGEELKFKLEEEEKEREVLRVVSRRTREQVMDVGGMVDETSPSSAADLVCPARLVMLCLADGYLE